jgi:hypothetical protein
MSDVEARLDVIEKRLHRLEGKGEGLDSIVESRPEQVLHSNQVAPVAKWATAANQAQRAPEESVSITTILGWGGATAIVLAAAYLIRLAIGSGWLTPTKQVAAALLIGAMLVAAGIRLKETDRHYASLLPAGGIVIFFLSVYGAHLYYELINLAVAGAAVVAICIAALILCRVFTSQLYAFFAVVGSYSAPFLFADSATSGIVSLIVYYSCWSVIFSAFSIWVKDRRVYLLALYLSLAGFDLLWRISAPDAWQAIVIFQLVQLLIFVSCAVMYATRHNSPMTREVALAHAPALLMFYALEYAVLEANLPGVAPWLAATSAGVILVAYRIARSFLGESLAGSKWLLAAYCALVLLHAGYIETIPSEWWPWAAFLLSCLVAAALIAKVATDIVFGPIGFVIAGIYLVNYFQLLTQFEVQDVAASELLLFIYAIQIYVGYYFIRKESTLASLSPVLIYGGHTAAMCAVLHQFDSRLLVSVSWAALAMACLALSLRYRDKILGQSSLLILGVSAVKVFTFDIASASPVVRIGCLAALGVTLYVGGLLYKRVEMLDKPA